MQLLIDQRDSALAEVSSLKSDLISIAEENEEAIATIRQLTSKNEQMNGQVQMLTALVRRLASTQGKDFNPSVSGDTSPKSP